MSVKVNTGNDGPFYFCPESPVNEPFNRPPAEPTLRERVTPVGNTDAFPPPKNQEANLPLEKVAPATATGWQCPACRGCYAPGVAACPNCRPDVLAALRTTPRLES